MSGVDENAGVELGATELVAAAGGEVGVNTIRGAGPQAPAATRHATAVKALMRLATRGSFLPQSGHEYTPSAFFDSTNARQPAGFTRAGLC